MKVTDASIRIHRTIDAPVDAVFSAWLEPEVLRRWFAPDDATVESVVVEPHVGGHFRLYQTRDGQRIGGFEARIAELVPNERIVFQWRLVGPLGASGPIFDSILTLMFQSTASNATLLTLVHEHLDELRSAMPDLFNQFEAGWNDVLQKLESAAA
jgi:uncharacterized protein YndB with AHSA1/START domain